jgi:hypothetical protein
VEEEKLLCPPPGPAHTITGQLLVISVCTTHMSIAVFSDKRFNSTERFISEVSFSAGDA